jgi:hypothetical protein
MCKNHKRIRCIRDRCARTDYSGITKIILAKVRWIIAIHIRGALDVTLPAESSIDCDGETCIRGAIIPEVVRLVVFGSCEPAAWASN